MNRDCGDRPGKIRTHKTGGPAKWKINTLLTELLEKDEEITLYKKRLKELETAFYYNLELLSERDLELSVLEKKLGSENEQVQDLIRERDELEDLIRVINDKNNRKIKKLESNLALKEEEMKNIQRESVNKVNTMKSLLEEAKRQQEKLISKMSTKFEIQKRKLVKSYREEIEEKEKYYVLEIDNLSGKLEQAFNEKEELIKAEEENRNELQNIKRIFREKENRYLEDIQKRNGTSGSKVNREIQCDLKPQVSEQKVQAQAKTSTGDSQTDQDESGVEYERKINFLQEQNEVLKYIVKDLKRKQGGKTEEPGQPPGCECFQIRTEIDKINKKFETEVNNLKKILEEAHAFRTEEDGVIQSLETSVTVLKEKLLSELQEKLQDCEGEDICAHAYNRGIQNEIQVTLLEQKLSRKIDSFVTAAEEENRKVHQKLEEFKRECADKMEKCLKPEVDLGSENLLQRIRMEIQKLEEKIESDMKNLVKNNQKEKNYEAKSQFPEGRRPLKYPKSSFPEVLPGKDSVCCKSDFSPEKFISIFKCNQTRKGFGEERGLRKVKNNLTLGR